jgi:LysM domain-containing protein
MTYYEPPQRARYKHRSALDSPLLAALLVAVVAGLVWSVFLGPRLLGSPEATAAAVLPTGQLPSATTPGPSGEPTFARPTPSPGPRFETYTVRRGDSLNSIARKFKTTARSIAWWNRGAYPSLDPESTAYDPSTIRVGWKLVYLKGVVVDDSNPPTPSPAPASPAAS